MFRNDQPIESVGEDLLGRKKQAVELARYILRWNGSGSLVVGIHGPWGDGKSSLKNMVLEQIREGQTNPPVVLNFNPWFQSGEGHVASSFFRLVGEKLREEGLGLDPEASAERWDSYARYFEISSRVATASDFAAPLFGIVPGFGAFASKRLRLAAKASRDAAESQRTAIPQSFEKLREQLTEDFRQFKRKLLVVVDDMDRLTEEEIRIVFRLIKSVGEFPNTIYLPLFQKSTVEKALNPVSGNEGADFLKKIVQVDIPVPPASSKQLAHFVVAGLKDIFGGAFDTAMNEQRLTSFWQDGMGSWFRNLRDVTRFMNSYRFMADGLRTEDSFEVNMVDLMVVEALRIFEPAAYDVICASKSSLVEQVTSQASDQLEELADSLLQVKGNRLSKGRFQEVVANLFPALRSPWSVYAGGDSSATVRDKLVCSEEFFERYFGFGLSEGQLSEAMIDRLKAAKSERGEIKQLLSEFRERGVLAEVLTRMKEEDEIFKDPSLAYPLALMDECDRWPETPSELGFLVPGFVNATHAAYRSVSKRKRRNDRIEALQRLICESSGLVAAGNLLKDMIEKPQQFDVDKPEEGRLSELKEIWINRIKESASDGSLAEVENMESVLRFWAEWGDLHDVLVWRKKLTAYPSGIVRLLSKLTNRSSGTYGDGRYRELVWISWQLLDKICEKEVWESYRKSLSEHETEITSGDAKSTSRLLDEALARWEKQEPDGSSRYEEEEEEWS